MKKHLKLLLRIMVKIDVEAVLCISRHHGGMVRIGLDGHMPLKHGGVP